MSESPRPTIEWRVELQRQRCKACWHADGFDFHVPTEVWEAVVPEDLQNHVVCLRCFDRFAHDKSIDYARHVERLYFAGGQASFVFEVARG